MHRRVEDKLVSMYTIGAFRFFAAYEPENGHSTIRTFEDDDGERRWYGRIGTNPSPESYAHLSGNDPERWCLVSAAYRQEYERAYAVIVNAFPEASVGRRDDGEIILTS